MTKLNEAAQAVSVLETVSVGQSADEMAAAFKSAGERIARSLEKAAQSGSLSFENMAESVLKDLARLTMTQAVEAPLTALIDGLSKRLGAPSNARATTVNLTVSGASDPDGFRRSEGQISATLARAVSLGQQRI